MAPKFFTASLVASALLGALGAAPALAQGVQTPRIYQAQQDISARIQQGMASGQITPSEAQVLMRRERDIQMRENQFKANGAASPQERQQLRAELGALSAEVERMMANRDMVRPPGQSGNTPGIDNQQRQIGQRIEDGVRSGRLHPREARRLHDRERELARREAFFKSDGVLSFQERRQLRDETAALRQDIERLIEQGRGRGHGNGRG